MQTSFRAALFSLVAAQVYGGCSLEPDQVANHRSPVAAINPAQADASAVEALCQAEPGGKCQLVITAAPVTIEVNQVSRPIEVQLQTSNGKSIPLAGVAITLSADNILGGTTSGWKTQASGTATVNNWTLGQARETKMTLGSAVSSSATINLQVTDLPTARLALTKTPDQLEMNVATSMLVGQFVDASGNPVARSGVTVQLSSSLGKVFGEKVVSTSDETGSVAFNFALDTVGDALLTLSAEGYPPVQHRVQVTPMRGMKVAVLSAPPSVEANQPVNTLKVQLQNQDGKPVLLGAAPVTVTTNLGRIGMMTAAVFTATNGAASIGGFSLDTVGRATLTIAAPNATAAEVSLDVVAPSGSKLAVVAPANSATVHRAMQPIDVQVQDAAGKVLYAPGIVLTVLPSIGSLEGSITGQTTNAFGSARLSGVVLSQSGPVTLTISAAGFVAATLAVQVLPELPTRVALVAAPPSFVANDPASEPLAIELIAPTNAAPIDNVLITVTSNSGTLGGVQSIRTDAAGRAEFIGLTLDTVGFATLTVSAPGFSTLLLSRQVQRPDGSHLEILSCPTSVTAGAVPSQPIVVQVVDAQNNALKAPNVPIELSPNAGNLGGKVSGWTTGSNGKAYIDDWTLINTASATLTLSATGYGHVPCNVTVNAPLQAPAQLTYGSNPASYMVGTAVTPNLPSSTGGVVASYAVSPPLPLGLVLNQATGVITGTPSVAAGIASYTVTATNTAGSTTAMLVIGVTAAPQPLPAPSQLTYGVSSATYMTTVAIAPNHPSSLGGAVASYSVNPTLPPGLTLHTTTGIISGTPTAPTATSSYVVTATNATGSATASLTITVVPFLAAPSALTFSANPATYTSATAITPNVPSSSGGAVASYSVTPALPLGLKLNTTTGIISGTPMFAASARQHTVTATNASGSSTATLTITVEAAPNPTVTVYGYHYAMKYHFPSNPNIAPSYYSHYSFGVDPTPRAIASYRSPYPYDGWETVVLSSDATPLAKIFAQPTNGCTVPVEMSSFNLNVLYVIGYACSTQRSGTISLVAPGFKPYFDGLNPRSVNTSIWMLSWVGSPNIISFTGGLPYGYPAGTAVTVATVGDSQRNAVVSSHIVWNGAALPGLTLRAQGATEGSKMYWGAINQYQLPARFEIWVFDTSWVQLGAAPVPAGVSSGTLEFSAVENQIGLRFNGNLVLQVADSTIMTAGDIGIRYLGDVQYSNYQAGSKADPPPVALPYTSGFATSSDSVLGGPAWDAVSGSLGLANGKVSGMGLAALHGVTRADATISARVSWTAGAFPGLFQRKTGSGDQNMYVALVNPGLVPSAVQLYKNVGGTWTVLASTPITPAGSTGILSFKVTGTQLSVSFDGVEKITATDTSISAPGALGIRPYYGGVEDLTVAP